jgi:hypothetical protein
MNYSPTKKLGSKNQKIADGLPWPSAKNIQKNKKNFAESLTVGNRQ